MRILSRLGAIAALSGSLLWGTIACSPSPTSSSSSSNSKLAATTVSEPSAVSPVVAPASGDSGISDRPAIFKPAQPDPYRLALEKADSASTITQSAQSPDDWNLVVDRWQQSIQLLRSVPATSPYRPLIKAKLSEYQRNLTYARKQASRLDSNEIPFDPGLLIASSQPQPGLSSPRSDVIASSPPSRHSRRVFRARIKRREGGTPVIDVRFNGRQTFEMIVDTGASGTVITDRMAAALGVQVVGKAKVDTASDRNVEVPLAYVHSMSVGGAVAKDLVVAIGGSALDVGLLGHDFFGEYDVTVKQSVVEFRQR